MKYKSNHNIIYSCKYHVVWCPKYRRKILSGNVETRQKDLLIKSCASRDVCIIELEIMPDHVHVLIQANRVWADKSKKISVKAILPKEYKKVFSSYKLGTLRINKKSHKYIAQIAIAVPEESSAKGTNILGADLGIKVPAVCVTQANKVKFVGNGRKNKYIRRHYKTKGKR